ncbi:MAG TPA: hypothetical protein VGR70_18785 [Stellaceae bacterium]|nr:hypothetical protein [Stellaceae bacterium]
MLRRNWLNIALIAVSMSVTFAVLEICLRLYDGIPLLQLTNFIGDRVNRAKQDTGFLYDERLGWQVKPNLHGPPNTTDAYGVRLPNNADRKLPVGAVLASGDSFTFGSDVSDAESWPADLEAMTGTPVVNAAVPGWGTDQIVMRAEDMIDIARPQTMIVDFLWYDIGRTEQEINFGAHKPYYTIEDNELVLHNVPVPPFEGRVHELGPVRGMLGYSYAVYWAAGRLGFDRWLGSVNTQVKRATPGGTGQRITCLLLKRLKQRTDQRGIRLIVVMQYGVGDFVRAQPKPAMDVISCAADMGAEVVDTWASIAEIYARDQALFRSLYIVQQSGWSHMSADGNRLIATMIADQLQSGSAEVAPSR